MPKQFLARSRLTTRFLVVGAMLLVATIACGAWSVYTFVRLSRSVGETLHDSKQTLDLTATLATHLEREDDSLLLALSGERGRARDEMVEQRRRFDEGYDELSRLLSHGDERAAAQSLREHVDAYRTASDLLVDEGDRGTALERYHQAVNPILRRAVADCSALREHNFRSMQLAGVRAHNEAQRAIRVVGAMLVAALVVWALAALYLARSVIRPVMALTEGIDALRQGDFSRRLAVRTEDELGRLADGFNRMADALDDFRRSNLGEVLRAKKVLETTLEALPDAIVVLDPEGRVESMNGPARRLLLQGADVCLGSPLTALPLVPEALRALQQAVDVEPSGRESRADLSRALPLGVDGSARRFLPISVPIRFGARGHGAIVVLYDVTEFARLDELRGEVVAVASHELQTPLTTIRMNLMLLAEQAENLTSRQREIVATALFGGEELERIVQRFLDVTRIEAGQLRLAREPVDLRSLIDECIARYRDRSAEVGVELTVQANSLPAIVNIDAARIGIVLSNLLTNALKYTPRGGAVTMSLALLQNAGSDRSPAVQVTITDTGPGIPREFRERVFDKFFRVEHEHPAADRGVRGAGLGLYLCRQIVQAHAGTIRAMEGEGGRGLKILITLPAEPSRTLRDPRAVVSPELGTPEAAPP